MNTSFNHKTTTRFQLFLIMASVLFLAGCNTKPKERYSPKPIDKDAPEEYTQHESGIKYRILRKTDRSPATKNDRVRISYRGTLEDGYEFESTYAKGRPSEFSVKSVVPGMREGLLLIGKGGMIDIIFPPEMGYGSSAKPGIPANSTLRFVIEVEDVMRKKSPRSFRRSASKILEEDADAPKEFSTTEKGIKYRLRTKSKRKPPVFKPIMLDTVALHFVIRLDNADGPIYLNSYDWGEGAEGPLNTLPVGFREGIMQCPVDGSVEFIVPPEYLGDRKVSWLKKLSGRLDPIPEFRSVHVIAEVFAIAGKDYPR